MANGNFLTGVTLPSGGNFEDSVFLLRPSLKELKNPGDGFKIRILSLDPEDVNIVLCRKATKITQKGVTITEKVNEFLTDGAAGVGDDGEFDVDNTIKHNDLKGLKDHSDPAVPLLECGVDFIFRIPVWFYGLETVNAKNKKVKFDDSNAGLRYLEVGSGVAGDLKRLNEDPTTAFVDGVPMYDIVLRNVKPEVKTWGLDAVYLDPNGSDPLNPRVDENYGKPIDECITEDELASIQSEWKDCRDAMADFKPLAYYAKTFGAGGSSVQAENRTVKAPVADAEDDDDIKVEVTEAKPTGAPVKKFAFGK